MSTEVLKMRKMEMRTMAIDAVKLANNMVGIVRKFHKPEMSWSDVTNIPSVEHALEQEILYLGAKYNDRPSVAAMIAALAFYAIDINIHKSADSELDAVQHRICSVVQHIQNSFIGLGNDKNVVVEFLERYDIGYSSEVISFIESLIGMKYNELLEDSKTILALA